MKLIVEMEMPSCCARCPLSERTTAFDQKEYKEVVGYVCDIECSFFMKEDDAAKRRAYGCPICGVLPNEHGDLIDRDIMHRELQLWKSTATDTTTMCFLWHVEKMLMCIRPNIAAERMANDD